jgi:hypothetical protein
MFHKFRNGIGKKSRSVDGDIWREKQPRRIGILLEKDSKKNMAFKLKVEFDAEKETDEAISWYESKRVGLGNEFLEELHEYYEILKTETPSFELKRKPTFRELPLKRFPYVIIYELRDKTIFVYSVFNTNQDPLRKRK